jgi:hypothetical protein
MDIASNVAFLQAMDIRVAAAGVATFLGMISSARPELNAEKPYHQRPPRTTPKLLESLSWSLATIRLL